MRNGMRAVRISLGSGLVKGSPSWLTLESIEVITCGQAPSRSSGTRSFLCLPPGAFSWAPGHSSHIPLLWFLSFLGCPLPCPHTPLLNALVIPWEETSDGLWMLVLASILLVCDPGRATVPWGVFSPLPITATPPPKPRTRITVCVQVCGSGTGDGVGALSLWGQEGR